MNDQLARVKMKPTYTAKMAPSGLRLFFFKLLVTINIGITTAETNLAFDAMSKILPTSATMGNAMLEASTIAADSQISKGPRFILRQKSCKAVTNHEAL